MSRSTLIALTLGCSTFLASSSFASLLIEGSIIPDFPEDSVMTTPLSPGSLESLLTQAQTLEAEATKESYLQAAEAYKTAGINGHPESFIRLGYLYERRHIIPATTVEEYRFVDAFAAYYIEKGSQTLNYNPSVMFHFLPQAGELEENQTPSSLSLHQIQNDRNLKLKERLFKSGQWYESSPSPQETMAQCRLRFAYAGRYYEEAALYKDYPPAYTALGHMYYFGKGIDISELPLSARLQAKEYYEAGATRDDPEAHFMMGFLFDQEQNQDDQAIFHYQASASQNHPLSCFRLGLRYEQGQAGEMNTSEQRQQAYQQAQDYYQQALESPKPPLHMARLVGYPEDLNAKIKRVISLKEQPQSLATPAYSLVEYAFCQYLKSYNALTLLPYWVDRSLARYSQAHEFNYRQDILETETRVKDIAKLFSGTMSIPLIPDLNAYEQKALNIQTSKSQAHPAAQQMRLMQIKQYLGREDERWHDSPSPEVKSHVHAWLESIDPVIKEFHNLFQPFDGLPFIETVSTRIQGLPLEAHTLDAQSNLWPEGYEQALGRQLFQIHHESEDIFQGLPRPQRTLAQQILLYKYLQKLKQHTGAPYSQELLEETLLASKLMKEVGDDSSEDQIIHHFQSARALKLYAQEKQLSLEAAKAELDQKAREVLPLLSPQLHNFSIIGYNILKDLVHGSSDSQSVEEASRRYREKLLLSLNQDDLDNKWIRLGNADSIMLSGHADQAATALTNLYKQAVEFIQEEQANLGEDQPVFNLKALTFKDPYVGLYAFYVEETFKDLQTKAKELYQAGEMGLSEQDIYESFLNEEIAEIQNHMNQALEDNDRAKDRIDHIISVLEDTKGIAQKIERKQNLLFMLRKSADWEEGEIESQFVAVQALLSGTAGRCADGQATFYQEWVLQYMLSHLGNTDHEALSQAPLKLNLSLFLQDYKRLFIEQHGSPFTLGGEEGLNANEDRTAMKTLLTQMLRLPLNLTGSYSSVLYPSYATRCLEDKERVLQIRTVMERFLKGGEILYKDYRTTQSEGELVYHDTDFEENPELYEATISFEGTTLKTLGKAIRSVLYRDVIPDAPAFTDLPGILPPPRPGFFLNEVMIEKFLQYDPLIASFYSTFKQSDYSQGNLFFDQKAAFKKGYKLKHVLTDAALLRMLEVTGYVKVPEGFYQTVDQDWKFPL
jgi:hypothetical protein